MTPSGNNWMAVSGSPDLVVGSARAIAKSGEDIVIWRSSSGEVRAWENRCIHRGMRLSFGQVRGERLSCRYHGWQFDLNGQCSRMPATPDVVPAATLCMPAFHCVEQNGLIWVNDMGAETAELEPLTGEWLFGKSLYIDENADKLKSRLSRVRFPRFSSAEAGDAMDFHCEHKHCDALLITASAEEKELEQVLLALQSIDESQSAVHCCLALRDDGQPSRDLRLRFHRWIMRLRWFLQNPGAEYNGFNPLPLIESSAEDVT